MGEYLICEDSGQYKYQANYASTRDSSSARRQRRHSVVRAEPFSFFFSTFFLSFFSF